MPSNGSVTFGLNTGKSVGPFQGVLNEGTPKEGPYLDVTKGGKEYPTRLDFGKFQAVKAIEFKSGLGKKHQWTSWTYYNHGEWTVDRFTHLS